jgi:hypothetical protein
MNNTWGRSRFCAEERYILLVDFFNTLGPVGKILDQLTIRNELAVEHPHDRFPSASPSITPQIRASTPGTAQDSVGEEES